MGQPVARVGDTCSGTCPGHLGVVAFTGTFLSGTSEFTVDGIPVILVGATAAASCGHTITVTTGSSVVDVDGTPICRQGDSVVTSGGGTGTIDIGSPNVDSD